MAHLFTIIRDLRARGKRSSISATKWMRSLPSPMRSASFATARVGAKHHRIYPPVADHPDGGPRINQLFPKFNNTIGEEVLTVRNLTRQGVFHDVSFSVRRGEIWAWPGWWAPGAAVMESLFGMERFDSGEVLIDGAPVTIDSPPWRLKKGWHY